MARQTITEADKYPRTQLLQGVVEEIVDASPMFAFLPFDTVLGNSLTYNRENTLGTAQFYDPGDTWVESTPTVTAVTAKLKIAGGDADLDKFLALTRSNEQDLRATMLSMKVKALVRSIENELIYGDVDDINAKGFDGLHEILGVVTGAQDVVASRMRVKWYMSLVLMSPKALARLSGVDTQDWTN